LAILVVRRAFLAWARVPEGGARAGSSRGGDPRARTGALRGSPDGTGTGRLGAGARFVPAIPGRRGDAWRPIANRPRLQRPREHRRICRGLRLRSLLSREIPRD